MDNQKQLEEIHNQEHLDSELIKNCLDKLTGIAFYLEALGNNLNFIGNTLHGNKLSQSAENMMDCVDKIRKAGYRDTHRQMQLSQMNTGNLLSLALNMTKLPKDKVDEPSNP